MSPLEPISSTHFWVFVSLEAYVLLDGTLGAVGVWGRAGYTSYVPLSSSLGTVGELVHCVPSWSLGGDTGSWLAAETHPGTCQGWAFGKAGRCLVLILWPAFTIAHNSYVAAFI